MLDEPQPPQALVHPARSEVCAVIVTYNIGEAIHSCFNSIRDQVGHVLIVDNDSDEPTQRELKNLEMAGAATIIRNSKNEGLAHAFNQAVQWAQSKDFRWILTLDHDSEATPDMVRKLLRAYANLELQGINKIGVIGANPFDLNNQHFLMYEPRETEGIPLEDTEVISSGSLIALQVFEVVGKFNEDLFIYFVDTDICMRLTRCGFHVFVCPEAILLHREGTKRRRKFLWIDAQYDHYGRTARYYLTRNTVYMIKKHSLTLTNIFWLLRRVCKDHAKILLFDENRLSLLRYSMRGLIDGLRGKVGPMKFQEKTK